MLVTIAEHGVTPSVTAARLTYAAAPDSIQGATASGLLGAGKTLLGSMQEVAEMVQGGIHRVNEGAAMPKIAEDIVRDRDTLPGFGHPSHEPTDPRTDRLFTLLEEEGLDGKHLAMIQEIQTVAEAEFETELLINATGAIGTVASELELDPVAARGIALVARAAGLTAHLVEEKNNPMAWNIWSLVGGQTNSQWPVPDN
jgi:citrate synthase